MGYRLGRLPRSSQLGQVSGGQWAKLDQRRARGPSNVVSVTGRVMYLRTTTEAADAEANTVHNSREARAGRVAHVELSP